METPSTRHASAHGHRSVAVGGNITGPVYTGDFFLGQGYERLQDAYISPTALYQELNLDRFQGREWLLREVDSFLDGHSHGYFVLEAEAGLGKTTFLAWLARQRRYPHHFARLGGGSDTSTALRNLAAQIIVEHDLADEVVDGILPPAAGTPNYFNKLLWKAAERRSSIERSNRLVIVVDGLDEAETPAAENPLGLPHSLPNGVFFIISHRPGVRLRTETPRPVFHLEPSDSRNIEDMHAYLEHAATRERVVHELDSAGYSAQDFVQTLLAKCQGVWIYLSYVIAEIEQGRRSPLDLDSLPIGLWQYYAQYWERWRREHTQDWHQLYLPLLATLAALQEGVALHLLCRLAEIEESASVSDLLDEVWRPFLIVVEQDDPLYSFYHASLRQFFHGQVDLKQMAMIEQNLVRQLRKATRTAHARIADYYLGTWGGLETSLKNLRAIRTIGPDLEYGLQYLAVHLIEAGQVEAIHELLRLEWIEESPEAGGNLTFTNAWHRALERAGYGSRYASDVETAWRAADATLRRQPSRRSTGSAVALQIRYALIAASLRSIAARVPPALVVALVEHGVWSPAQALSYAKQVPEPQRQSEILSCVMPYLSGKLQAQAITISQELIYPRWRALTLTALAEHIDIRHRTHVLEDAIAAIEVIHDELLQAEVIVRVLPLLPCPSSTLARILQIVHSMSGDHAKAEALTGMIPNMPEAVWPEALQLVIGIRDESYSAKVLSSMAERLPEGELAASLRIAEDMADEYWRGQVLAALSSRLPESMLVRVLTSARATHDAAVQADLLGKLAARLPRSLHPEALAICRETGLAPHQVNVITLLAPRLASAQLREALSMLRDMGRGQTSRMSRYADGGLPSQWQAKGLQALGPFLHGRLLLQALSIAETIEDDEYRTEAITALIRRLGAEDALRSIAATAMIEDGPRQVEALAVLVRHAPSNQRDYVIREILRIVNSLEDEGQRARALAIAAREALSDTMRDSLLDRAMVACQGVWDDAEVVASLVPLIEVLEGESFARVLKLAIRLTGSIEVGELWYMDSEGEWQSRKIDDASIKQLINERTSAAVKDALRSLLKAPAPANSRASRKRGSSGGGTRRSRSASPPRLVPRGSAYERTAAGADFDLLSKVKEAISANSDGARKADVINAAGITSGQWNMAIKALLAEGSVTQTGERRGTRYHLAGVSS